MSISNENGILKKYSDVSHKKFAKITKKLGIPLHYTHYLIVLELNITKFKVRLAC